MSKQRALIHKKLGLPPIFNLRDPNAPTQHISSYNLFAKEVLDMSPLTQKMLFGSKSNDTAQEKLKFIVNYWKALSADDKQV